MKLQEILEMEAGPDLNWLVHRIIFGRTMSMVMSKDGAPDYSGDISAAWSIVEKMPLPFGIHKFVSQIDGNGFMVNWCKTTYECENCNIECGKTYTYQTFCKSAPLAICRAALIIVLRERGELEE